MARGEARLEYQYAKLCALGIDPLHDKTEWTPQIYLLCAGIVADTTGFTGVGGLFAAGTARSSGPGLYLEGFALMQTAVTGYWTGEAAGREMNEVPCELNELDQAQLRQLAEEIYAPMQRANRSSPQGMCLLKLRAQYFLMKYLS